MKEKRESTSDSSHKQKKMKKEMRETRGGQGDVLLRETGGGQGDVLLNNSSAKTRVKHEVSEDTLNDSTNVHTSIKSGKNRKINQGASSLGGGDGDTSMGVGDGNSSMRLGSPTKTKVKHEVDDETLSDSIQTGTDSASHSKKKSRKSDKLSADRLSTSEHDLSVLEQNLNKSKLSPLKQKSGSKNIIRNESKIKSVDKNSNIDLSRADSPETVSSRSLSDCRSSNGGASDGALNDGSSDDDDRSEMWSRGLTLRYHTDITQCGSDVQLRFVLPEGFEAVDGPTSVMNEDLFNNRDLFLVALPHNFRKETLELEQINVNEESVQLKLPKKSTAGKTITEHYEVHTSPLRSKDGLSVLHRVNNKIITVGGVRGVVTVRRHVHTSLSSRPITDNRLSVRRDWDTPTHASLVRLRRTITGAVTGAGAGGQPKKRKHK